MSAAKVDLTITWDETVHDTMISHIEALIAKGIGFYRLGQERRHRKRVVLHPISGTSDIMERKLVIRASEIARITGPSGV
jgi:hypothetical protein